MFAIIETGGKQYRVSPGQKLKIEKIEAQAGDSFSFRNVLLTGEEGSGSVQIGTPYTGATVEAKVLSQGRHEKKIIFRYHSKTRYRKKKGHRQPFTELEIVSIK